MTHVHRVFDRRPSFDERSRQFSIRPLLAEEPLPRSYTWRTPQLPRLKPSYPLDQGAEGACVGFAWAHELAVRPVVHHTSEDLARFIYREARRVDEWEGEDYEGTSVLAGAKIVQKLGWQREYRWAFSLDEALTVTSRHGPSVLGLNWYTGMMETDLSGYIRPTGRVEGGHAILMVGVHVPGRYALLMNSWGLHWGLGGFCRITWDDLGRLLAEQGECCVPVHRLKVPPQRQP